MSEREPVLRREFDDQIHVHTRANLLVRLEKLLEYNQDDLDDLAFERNFRECQKMYEQLKQVDST